MAGSSFVVAMEPLLNMLRNICGHGQVLAFADDIALVVDMSVLSRVAQAFEVFGRATAMRFRADKCVLIPLCLDDTDAATRDKWYSRMLAEYAPEWQTMQVAGSATYLGTIIGPDAGAEDRQIWPTLAICWSSLAGGTQKYSR